jgi:hypothetical protein
MSQPFTLLVPIDPRYRPLASAAAARYAELLGGPAAEVAAFATKVADAVDALAEGAATEADVELAFRAEAGGISVELRSGGQSRVVRHGL